MNDPNIAHLVATTVQTQLLQLGYAIPADEQQAAVSATPGTVAQVVAAVGQQRVQTVALDQAATATSNGLASRG